MATPIKEEAYLSLKIDKNLKTQVEQYAEENELDNSKVVRIALKKFFNQSPVSVKSATRKAG